MNPASKHENHGGPEVSVILPCYEVTEYVAEALDSLRGQTFRNFETIIVNDGCPDTANLEKALGPYRREIVYIRQENQGIAGARNTAIRAARAPIVALLDPDDAWEPEYLEEQMAVFRAHPEADVVYPDALLMGRHIRPGAKFSDCSPMTGEVTWERLVSDKCIVFGSSAIRRERMLRVGLYDPEVRCAEDRELWLRMAKAGAKFVFNPKPVYRYRVRGESLSGDTLKLRRAVVELYERLLRNGDLTKDERACMYAAIERRTAEIDLTLGKKALYAGRYEEALRNLRAAGRTMNDNRKLRGAIFLLQVWPGLLSAYVHRRYPTESSYVR